MCAHRTFQVISEHGICRYLSLTWCGHLASYHCCGRTCCLYGRNSVVQNRTVTAVKFCLDLHVTLNLSSIWSGVFGQFLTLMIANCTELWGCAKLIVAHLPKDNLNFTRSFTTVFTGARLCFLPTPSQTSSRITLMCSHLFLGLASGFFTSGFYGRKFVCTSFSTASTA